MSIKIEIRARAAVEQQRGQTRTDENIIEHNVPYIDRIIDSYHERRNGGVFVAVLGFEIRFEIYRAVGTRARLEHDVSVYVFGIACRGIACGIGKQSVPDDIADDAARTEIISLGGDSEVIYAARNVNVCHVSAYGNSARLEPYTRRRSGDIQRFTRNFAVVINRDIQQVAYTRNAVFDFNCKARICKRNGHIGAFVALEAVIARLFIQIYSYAVGRCGRVCGIAVIINDASFRFGIGIVTRFA